MEHISKQLEVVLNKKGLLAAAQSARVCLAFNNYKKKNFGGGLKVEAISFKGGILKVGAGSSIELSEIKMKEREIKKALNEKLKREVVKSLNYKITT